MLSLGRIGSMVLQDLERVWPLLVISIPFAVVLRVSGVSTRLTGAFGRRPLVGILLATAAGAFGPFCSCSIVPVIASMLIGGVPLAPVMSFWVASPTMDPEIFFMSAAFLGWPLAIGRLTATLILSLAAGFVTHGLVRRGWVGADFLREGATASRRSVRPWARLRTLLGALRPSSGPAVSVVARGCGCSGEGAPASVEAPPAPTSRVLRWLTQDKVRRVLRESASTTLWVARFMAIAFLLEALIKLYVPQPAIVQWIGQGKAWGPALAAFVGIPLYTGNLMAVPMVGGLLTQGMNPGAALAFLIAGPITTLPAMAAVWGVVRRRVFLLYVGIGLAGAIALGYAYDVVSLLRGG